MAGSESLERRILLAVSVNLVGTQIRIVGDDAANTVVVELKTLGADSIRVSQGSVSNDFDLAKVSTLLIDLKGGNDNLTVGEINFGIFAPDKSIPRPTTVLGGHGNDVIVMAVTNSVVVNDGLGNDNVAIAAFTTTFQSAGGNDTLTGDFGSDTFQTGVTPDGSDTIDGRGGRDTIDFAARTAGVTIKIDQARNDGAAGESDYVKGVEVLRGTPFADAMLGSSASDSISGFGGDDTVDGGLGADTLSGGQGKDTLLYGSGSAIRTKPLFIKTDTIANDGEVGEKDFVAADFEVFAGGNGNDTIFGTNGPDRLTGRLGNDKLFGLGGNDTIQADGKDTLDGGDNDDLLSADASGATLIGGRGNDTLNGATANDSLLGGDGNDALAGDAGNDTLDGQDGNDTLLGGAGNDFLVGAAGNDSVVAGDGDDQVGEQILRIGEQVVESGNDTIDGGAGNDNIGSGPGTDSVTGGDGNDTLIDKDPADDPRADSIDGGTGNDRISSTAGQDTLRGSAGDDTITGGTGNELILGSDGNDCLLGGIGGDLIKGGNGTDTVAYARSAFVPIEELKTGTVSTVTTFTNEPGRTAPVNVKLDNQSNDGAVAQGASPPEGDNVQEMEIVIGTTFGDTLGGDNNPSILFGIDGDDAVFGNGGNDTLSGGNGNDLVDGALGDDLIHGDAGNDSLRGADGDDTLFGDDGNDTLDGNLGTDDLNGGNGNDFVVSPENDFVDLGDQTADAQGVLVNGTSGDDVIEIRKVVGVVSTSISITVNGETTFALISGCNTVVVNAGAGDDRVTMADSSATPWHARFNGDTGNDTLTGGPGDDTLLGGPGLDLLLGGGGDDTGIGRN